MNFHQSIFQNNSLKIVKYLALITLIFLLSFKANTEIPEKYKIESNLPKCKGTNYIKWTDCYGEYTFPRNEYKGEWKDGAFHGQGIYKESWGDIYIGNFVNNKAEGFGRQDIYEDGEIAGSFGGELKNDLLNGKGYYDYKGCRDEGYFKNHKLHGEGQIICDNGYQACCNFKDGKLHGPGSKIFTSGSTENGNYVNGLLHGMGTFIDEYGVKYEGEWVEDMKEGKGIFTWPDGEKYIGQFKNDQRNGFGKYYLANGDYYEGNWKDNMEHGKGKFVWTYGDKYVGDFDNGYRSGQGKYTYESGTVYEGDFNKNLGEGNGKFTYSTGEIYVGEVKNGYEHGQGTMVYPNGDEYIGRWEEGYKHGQGKMVYADGNIYEGLFENGKEVEGKTTLAKFTTNEKYYALIIGNNNYEELIKLDNAVNDAIDLDKVLKEKYGFKTTLMLDKKSDEIERAIIEFTDNRKRNDNILIYYAGHGKLIKKQKLERGYWLPVDAGPNRDPNWISNNDIKDSIASSNAKHILLIVDSCFSGSLMRGSGENKLVEKLTSKNLDRLKSKTTRLVITSGGNEDVADGIGEAKNSVFAEPLIEVLKNNTKVIRSYEIFNEVRTFVINNADQTPNHSLIHGTGHDGGEFLFFPKS